MKLSEILDKKYLEVDENGVRLILDNPKETPLYINISLERNPEKFSGEVSVGEDKVIFTDDEWDNIYDFLSDALDEYEEGENTAFTFEDKQHTLYH